MIPFCYEHFCRVRQSTKKNEYVVRTRLKTMCFNIILHGLYFDTMPTFMDTPVEKGDPRKQIELAQRRAKQRDRSAINEAKKQRDVEFTESFVSGSFFDVPWEYVVIPWIFQEDGVL